MRVAALYDVHAMPHALEAVLADLERDVDAIVFGGDVFLRAASRGDARARPFRRRAVRPRQLRPRAERVGAARSSTRDGRRVVARVAADVELDGVLYCHATPRSDMPILTDASRPRSASTRRSTGVDARLVVAGHTHMQFRRGSFVNAGSVGMPYEDEVAAFWARRRRRRRVPQDGVRRRARDPEIGASGWPEREEFVAENLLAAPSRARGDRAFRAPCLTASTVGRVGKPHGIEGAFVVEDASEDPERFAVGAELFVDGERPRSSSRSAPAAGR